MKTRQCISPSTRPPQIWHQTNMRHSLQQMFLFGMAFAVSLALTSHADTVTVPSGSILTIQDGINAAAPGDTVAVRPGIYAGGAVVSTPDLTLSVAGPPGSVKIIGAGPVSPWVSIGLRVSANGVTIQGFDVSGVVVGIWVDGLKGVQITGNHLHDNSLEGIVVTSGASLVRVDHNSVENNGYSGILVEDCRDVRVDHNSAKGSQIGILLAFPLGVDVDHNTVTGNVDGLDLWVGATGGCGNTLDHNTAQGNTNRDLASGDDPAASCNSYKDNYAEIAYPSLSLWDVK